VPDEHGNVTHDEACDAEARLLKEYGITAKNARALIEDARAVGGIDRLLRLRAQADAKRTN
jgi:hypothetical protein